MHPQNLVGTSSQYTKIRILMAISLRDAC